MSITELSVKKPLATLMVVFLFVGLGILGYMNMGSNLYPDSNMPIIAITTSYTGASTEEIENDITKPIENALANISGVDKMSSISASGYGRTTITFTMETDMQTAFMDVQQAVSGAMNELPADASKPVIMKYDMGAQPVLILSVANTGSYGELYDSSDKIKNAMQKIEGVGGVDLVGGVEKQLSIKVDKTLADKYGVSISTILGTIQNSNLNIPGGQISQGSYNQSIRVLGQFQDVEKVKDLHIPMLSGGTIRLQDIAEVKLDYPDKTQVVRVNGDDSIGIVIQKKSDANIVKTVESVKKELKKLEKTMPEGVKVSIVQDSSTFIVNSLEGVKGAIIEGIITTSIVMFIFLKRVKTSFIVLIAIPTSLIATFSMMYMFKFSLNTISLLALSLCIGILVDDSIVVIENIQRHLKQGKSVFRATIDGRKEIAMAAISLTLCDVVVFGPIAFMSGMVGQFFKEFGLTVVFAALFSLAVSFTLTPMLASRLLEEEKDSSDETKRSRIRFKAFEKISNKFNEASIKFSDKYKDFLTYALNNRGKVIIAVILMLVASIALIPMKVINAEFMSNSDQGNLTIEVKLSPNSDINLTNDKIKIIEGHLKDISEVKEYFSIVGDSNKESTGKIYVMLTDKEQRKKSQSQIASELRKWSKTVTGAQISVAEASSSSGGGSSSPISISIKGDQYEVLKSIANKIESSIETVPGLIEINNSVSASESEFNIQVDELMASRFGIKPSDIASTLRTVSKQGAKSGVFRRDGDEYDIVVKLNNEVKTKEEMDSIKITNSSGQQVLLSQVAKISLADSAQQKDRTDREEVVTISANISGRPLSSVTEDVEKAVGKINLPDGYKVSYGGDQNMMADSFKSIIQVLIVSVILVYMVLVVLYESLLTPAIRMLSLPCGLIGALIALAVTGNSLNMVTMIGLVMLDGLSAKNGTLLIDYTNTLMHKKGLPLKEALLEAGTTRLRPIIMTTVTMIVGMVPSAISMSAGSETRKGMAIVIIGGMITSTLISPIIIPVVYTLMDDIKKKFGRKKNKKNDVNISEKGVMV
jgi:HAE1 family hydrophobic/amphiphilic exporter-1